MGKYDPLRDYLIRCGNDELILSFADIESIIGRTLPPSASKYDLWWANIDDNPFIHLSHARSWHSAGYKAQANRAAKTVCFYKESVQAVQPPLIDWNGNGRIDPVDVGIHIAAINMDEKAPLNSADRIALISCSKLKRPYRCKAYELYSASTLFSLSYEYAKANAERIYILSAKYGLVEEDALIEPYDETLNDKTPLEKKTWSKMVLSQLKQVCNIRTDEFIILAGKNYYEYLLPYLPHATLPLGKLPMGKRIEFLQRNLQFPEEEKIHSIHAAEKLHQFFEKLPTYNWQTIGDIPFEDGIYIVYEKGETYRGHERIVRVGTHTSQGRLKGRLMDHFVRENHNGSIFRKNIGKAMLNRDRDRYLAIWSLDTSRAPNIGKEDKVKEKKIENRVSEYMRKSCTFRVFPVPVKAERLRLEEAIIATLNQTDDFKAGRDWLGNSSPEQEIRKSGMWLKQGLDAEPLTDTELLRLSQLTSAWKERFVSEIFWRKNEPSLDFASGDRIHHTAFGNGTILSIQTFGTDNIAVVEFDESGKKKLIMSVAKKCITKLDV